MAQEQFRTVDHPSWHRRHRPELGRQQYFPQKLLRESVDHCSESSP